MGQRDVAFIAVTVIAHQDGQLAARLQTAGTIANELSIAAEKMLQRGRTGQIPWIVGIEFHAPVGGMCPDKIETVRPWELCRVTRIESRMDVERHAGDVHFIAYIAAGAGTRHGVKHHAWFEVAEQVFDQVAATIARIAAVAIFSGTVEVIEAGQMRNGTAVTRGTWQPGKNGLVTRLAHRIFWPRCIPFGHAACIEGIDYVVL
ncbi:hypothetical protein DSM3645_27992 [Blastopirellula marina DSM 3645]|uniref:Uncharacterized protein n=1 Tax=Blastopirellula marina DSM 3645 TaxID=314230 RepID=A3ZP24_9BACT|nr:hypothetical protein DSM3645_27992 [Blastopirellula marina DSM 3645]